MNLNEFVGHLKNMSLFYLHLKCFQIFFSSNKDFTSDVISCHIWSSAHSSAVDNFEMWVGGIEESSGNASTSDGNSGQF